MSFPTVTKEYILTKAEGYEHLQLHESPVHALKDNQVLVKVHAASLNFRDLAITKGEYPIPLKENVVPLADMAGEILAVGAEVKEWKVGDRVTSGFTPNYIHGFVTLEQMLEVGGAAVDGVLTQYKAFPAHSLLRIPDHLSYEEASTLPIAAVTAYNSLTGLVSVKGGDVVVVQGTGGVSIFALRFAVALGAIVIATSSSDEKLEFAKKLGATHLINYKTSPDWDQEVLRLTNGVGANHILEVGGSNTMGKSMSCIAQGGNIHVIGGVGGSGTPPDLLVPLIMKTPTIRGIMTGSLVQFKDMLRLLQARPEETRPIIDKVFTFDKAIDAYARMESGNHIGKVVIQIAH